MADQNLKDLVYRTAASIIGGPVDLAQMVMRPFGYSIPEREVVGGSEWLGKKLEEAGVIGSARAPLREFLASVAVPTPSGVAKGTALALGGIFIGKGARTWDALSAARAKELEKAGVDARVIWQETGTWKGPDGKWRQEIDDSGATIKGSKRFGDLLIEKYRVGAKRTGDQAYATTVEDVLFHPNLTAAYDNIGRIETQTLPAGSRSKGAIDRENTVLQLSESLQGKEAASVLLHELQHAIQQREGLATGGSLSKFLNEIKMANIAIHDANSFLSKVVEAKDAAKARGDIQEVERLTKVYNDAMQHKKNVLLPKAMQDPFDAYHRLAGEAEARAVQLRMNMTPEQRRAIFPGESYDVPLNELIVRTD